MVPRWLLALVALGALLRFATLDGQSFWFDEALTVSLVGQPLGAMVRAVLDTQAQPPPYFVLAWLWVQVLGDGEVGLRSLSALLGTLTIPVMWAVARRLAGDRGALAVALLTAVNPLLVWYSQEARGYALLVLLSALSLLLFVRCLERPSRSNLVLWTGTSVLAVASHYFAIFLVLPEAGWLLWRALRAGRARRTGWAIAGLASGLLLVAPMLLHQREHGGAEWIGGQALVPRMGRAAASFVVGPHMPFEQLSAAVAVVSLLVASAALVLALQRLGAPERRWLAVIAGTGLATVLLPFVGALAGADFVLDRNLLPAWPPLAVAVVAALLALRPRRLGVAVLGVTSGLSLAIVVAVATDPALQRDDWRAAAAWLGPAREDRVVAVVPWWQGHPLSVYEPGLHDLRRPQRVRQAVTVAYTGFVPFDEPIEVRSPPPPFREVRRFSDDSIEVRRFESPAPVLVDPRQLTGTGPNASRPYFERAE